MSLLGPNGRPISSQQFRKGPSPAMGPAYGDWAGRDTVVNQMPGGAVLQFNLDNLTLADFRAMRGHPQVNASLTLLWFMQHQIDWSIECEDKTAKGKKIAEQIESNMRRLWTQICRGMGQAFWAGYSPMALEYENANSGYVELTKVKDLYPEDCVVNWKTVLGQPGGNSSSAPPPYGYAEPIPSGHTSRSSNTLRPKFKEYNGIKQWGCPDIPVMNSFWYPVFMENGNYYGRKFLKAAFTPWYFSTLVHLYANRYFERFGEPLPIGRAPFEETFVDASGQEKTGKEVMEGMLMSLRNRSVVTLPSDRDPVTKEFDYVIEYLESQMRGADFDRYLDRLDEEISLAMLMPAGMMRTTAAGGQGHAIQQTQTWLWMNNAVAGDMKDYIDPHIVNRLVDINFGLNAPRCYWVPKPLGKENAETLRTIATEIIRGRFAEPDLQQLSDAIGIDLKPGPGPEQPVKNNPNDPNGAVDASGKPIRVDTRPRNERDRTKAGGRSVAEPRSTARKISARMSEQITNAYRRSTFGKTFKPDLGYHARFKSSLVTEGWTPEQAEEDTNRFYTNLESWFSTMLTISDDFAGPQDFMAMFDRKLDIELELLAGDDDS